ncbi:DNA gyrase subunit B [Devosia sp. SD17-2]|jgi:ElaB/YqjD/DUF883 family membrane-anchored ribosome-binding protein|uniref:DUF883 family protein n=1 Tax=Devosia sp. SD17-2 TaxID=2976459 RepID=UPI0023D7BF3C|nr:DNA gyrase subunit B [Devosia sp. SD17-2]WEJ34329.1 DNA gyrase subunit B [Devosia sp. SD17-2]
MANTPEMTSSARKAAASAADAILDTDRERELEAQVSQLQDDLKAITETLRKLTEEKAGEVKDIAQAEFRQLKRRGKHLIEDAQDQAVEYEEQLKDTIREKPLTAVAAAAGIGFVLALLTRH